MKTLACTTAFLVLCALQSCRDSKKSGHVSSIENEQETAHPAAVKLNEIIFPTVDIQGATVEDAFGWMRMRAMELDSNTDYSRRGVSFVIRHPRRTVEEGAAMNLDSALEPNLEDSSRARTIDLKAENIKMLDLVTAIAEQAQLDAYLTSRGFLILPEGSRFENSSSDMEAWKVLRKTPGNAK